MPPRATLPFLCALAGLGWAVSPASLAEDEIRFNRDVRPIFAEHCYTCHGPDGDARKAGLQLDRREEALAERESGHAILPGEAGKSLLIRRVGSGDPDEVMPPPESGEPLTDGQIEILRRWIDAGAEYEPHWSLIPPEPVAPPKAAGATHPVDRFVRARLEEEGLSPSPGAPRATLIRRLALDLTGLPPTPAEVNAFLEDTRPDAYGRLVDRLLASPHFGEKWARWWLDLAHYGDSDGIRLDDPRPYAWRFREWVVDALNDDLPFDRFTIRQLAGDLLADASVSERLATGFLRNTVSDRQTGNADPMLGRVRQVVDRTSTVGAVWMGLTMECAQCHDHKFDPISQKDFFRMYAFFNGAEEMNIDAPLPGELEKHRPARLAYERRRAELLEPLATRLGELQAEWEERMLWTERNPGADHTWGRAFELLVTSWGRGRGGGQFEGLMIIKTPPDQRSEQQKERLQDYFLEHGRVVAPEAFAELEIAELSKKLEALARDVPPLSRAQAMTQLPEAPVTRIHLGGDPRRPGETVGPGTPAVLPPLEPEASGTPTRLDLAKWLVSPDHPLTARVTVNRLWQELFGSGLVATSDNLGSRGESPTHPELLDWLATQFPERGWSLKTMLRLIVTSDTYRQSSDDRSGLSRRDPGNALLARQAKLRLSAEGVRDNALAVGGLLNPAIGGPSVRPPQPESVIRENTRNPWKADEGEARYRRGLYTFIQRLTPFVQFANFDLPDTTSVCARRERSNTPLQALNLLNDPTFVEAAHGLASRVCREVESDESARLERAFVLALARPPSAEEAERLTRHLREQTALFEADPEAAGTLAPDPFPDTSAAASAAWVTVASVLMNLHEFIHRE